MIKWILLCILAKLSYKCFTVVVIGIFKIIFLVNVTYNRVINTGLEEITERMLDEY